MGSYSGNLKSQHGVVIYPTKICKASVKLSRKHKIKERDDRSTSILAGLYSLVDS